MTSADKRLVAVKSGIRHAHVKHSRAFRVASCMARPVSLRLRHPKGTISLTGIHGDTTFEMLRHMIAQKLELAPVLRGTPPREFNPAPISLLTDLQLNGEYGTAFVAAPAPTPALVLNPAPVPTSSLSAPAPAKAAPVAPPAPTGPANLQEPPLAIGNDDDGYLVRRIVDSDNSCLFTSIGFADNASHNTAKKLRKVIADVVKAQPDEYSEVVLGRTPTAYSEWIQKPESWGGAIELAIFAKHYRTEIAAFDITTARHQIFGQDGNFTQRVLVMYDGIHYDPLALSFGRDLPEDLDQTIFPLTDTASIAKATAMCEALHKKRQFTNTGNFTLRCGICQEGIVGQKEAVEHAKKTGHTNFSEYK